MIIIVGVVVLIIAICMNVYLWKRRSPDGEILIITDRFGHKLFSLELDKTPEEIENMKAVSFKVVSVIERNTELKVDYSDDLAE